MGAGEEQWLSSPRNVPKSDNDWEGAPASRGAEGGGGDVVSETFPRTRSGGFDIGVYVSVFVCVCVCLCVSVCVCVSVLIPHTLSFFSRALCVSRTLSQRLRETHNADP